MTRRLLPFALMALIAPSTPALAQAPEVRGRISDAEGRPVADQPVLLHRVVGDSGANIAQVRSDSAGRFTIPVDTAGGSEAVYFLAARWQDELYIGDAFRPPLDTAEHLLQVGVPGTSATALLEGTTTMPGANAQAPPPVSAGGSPATRTRWLLFLAPAVGLLGVLSYLVLRNRPGVTPRRRLLARIAELDLEHAGADQDDQYRARRAELVAQLRAHPGP